MRYGWEGNRRSAGVTLAMCHRLSGTNTHLRAQTPGKGRLAVSSSEVPIVP